MEGVFNSSWAWAYMVVVLLPAYTGLVVCLARYGMVSKYDIGSTGRSGPPGPMGPMGVPGRDLHSDSKALDITGLEYETWLRYLNGLINERAISELTEPTEMPTVDEDLMRIGEDDCLYVREVDVNGTIDLTRDNWICVGKVKETEDDNNLIVTGEQPDGLSERMGS